MLLQEHRGTLYLHAEKLAAHAIGEPLRILLHQAKETRWIGESTFNDFQSAFNVNQKRTLWMATVVEGGSWVASLD